MAVSRRRFKALRSGIYRLIVLVAFVASIGAVISVANVPSSNPEPTSGENELPGYNLPRSQENMNP